MGAVLLGSSYCGHTVLTVTRDMVVVTSAHASEGTSPMDDNSFSDNATGSEGAVAPTGPTDAPQPAGVSSNDVPPPGEIGPPGPGWGGPLGPSPWGLAPPASASRRRRYLRPVAVAGLLAGVMGAGVGLGGTLWSKGTPVAASASAPTSVPGNSGSTSPSYRSGSGNPFSGSGSADPFSGSGSGSSSSSSGSSSTGPSDVSAIAAQVDPALVDINVTLDGDEPAAGTGIVLSADGEVLTNNHVVDGATAISVTDLGNGKTYGATVVGYSVTGDVAVIQLTNASGLQTAKIGNASKRRGRRCRGRHRQRRRYRWRPRPPPAARSRP